MSGLFGIFRDFPRLETDRLVLRQMLIRDKDDMYEYSCKPEITKYLLWTEHPSADYTAKYLRYMQPKYRRGEVFDWALVNKAENKMIGTCGFVRFDTENNAAEVGYVVSDKYWGKGYAAEALKRVIAFGFDELSLNRIYARHMMGNERSGRVMQKCGMRYEGIIRGSMYIKGKYCDVAQYAILKND
ncbi:MAG: GNAT family N-acetyltransferase [Clostridia bacterium]|nr:GNAT family N-acetyltransferase [Clostridia bacterium]